MANTQKKPQQSKADALQADIKNLRIYTPNNKADHATLIGFLLALVFIAIALYAGGSGLAFVNLPALLIVFGGTFGVVMMSFRMDDIASVPRVIARAFQRRDIRIKRLMRDLMDVAVLCKKHGVLSLSALEKQTKRDAFLQKTIQCISDGYTAPDIERMLRSEIASLQERHQQSTEILYRASEVAPAMGLIGTLIGLVQMLTDLDDPSVIGPSMAVALLTTLYGALLGSVVFAPMAAKLERNAAYEKIEKKMILIAAISMAKHENPRRLEIQLNSEVDPNMRIQYFDKP